MPQAELERAARVHTQALDAYLARKFARAAELFATVQDIMRPGVGVAVAADGTPAGPDRPSELLRARALAYVDNPPGPSWSGVDVLRGKKG